MRVRGGRRRWKRRGSEGERREGRWKARGSEGEREVEGVKEGVRKGGRGEGER